jgi:hypothetical protein
VHPVWFVIIVIVLVAVITVTQLRMRTQRLATYWIEPLALLILCWLTIDKYTSWHWTSHAWYLVGATIGVAIGALRGGATRVELGKEPGTFTAQGSWVTVALLLLIAGTNVVARFFLAGQAGVDVQRVTSPLLLVTAFNIIAWRAVMLSRYLKLKHQAPNAASTATTEHQL